MTAVEALGQDPFVSPNPPGTLSDRLGVLCDSMLVRCDEAGQAIRLEISVSGICPDELIDTLLLVGQEFIDNAIAHGMHVRAVGRIAVNLAAARDHTTLVVTDDGWGFHGVVQDGGGLSLARERAARHGGSIRLRRTTITEAILTLPHPPKAW